MIETISIDEIPRDPADALESRIRALEAGSAVKFTAGSPLGAGKALKAAMAACADLPGLNSKRVDTTVFFWFEG